MAADQDRGPGTEDHFPAEDLERLYRKGGIDIAATIQGCSLNKVMGVTTYEPDAWYLVTKDGVAKL